MFRENRSDGIEPIVNESYETTDGDNVKLCVGDKKDPEIPMMLHRNTIISVQVYFET